MARHVRMSDEEDIARRAGTRNHVCETIDLLVYSPSHFGQVLEGDEGAVTERVKFCFASHTRKTRPLSNLMWQSGVAR